MAELATLARPYARAAYDFADASNGLDQWSDMLSTLAAIATQEKVQAVFDSPVLTAKERAEALANLCGDSITDQGLNLLRLLSENGRLALIPEVSRLFEQFKANREKTVNVDITSAMAMDQAAEEKLAAALAAKLDRQVIVNSETDESLMGGAIIRAGDLVIDGSVRGKLAKLAEAINS
jgi:F-type H+-transporting ATPase subunit delta